MGPNSYGCLYTFRRGYSKSPFYRLGNLLKFFNRGLYALILTFFIQSQLVAEYLYKDEVIFNPNFSAEVETLGSELYQKTGIALRLVMLKELPHDKDILEYENELIATFNEPTVLLIFSEFNMQVDIAVTDRSLYEYFNRKQVLSLVASPIQAFVMALFYSDSFESFKEIASSHGGTIIPLLAGKAKKGEVLGKYSGSMFNGYADIAEQIAQSKNVELVNAVGNSNKNTILVVKVLFYGFIIYGIFLYIKRKLYIRRQKNEQK